MPERRSKVATLSLGILSIFLFFPGVSKALQAQTPGGSPAPAANATSATAMNGHEIYLSWGYNTESYRPVELHMSQPELANDFTLHAVDFHDSKGWSTGLLSHSV